MTRHRRPWAPLLAGLALLAACVLAAASPPVLQVGSEIGFPPFADVDSSGKAIGFSVDLFSAVARIMDLPVDYRVSDWNDAWNGLLAGRLDALPVVARLKEREGQLEFTSTHTIGYDGFFVRTGGPRLATIEEARPHRIIVMRSDAAQHALESRGFHRQLVVVGSLPDALRLLASGQYDAVLAPLVQGTMILQRLGLAGAIAAGPPLNEYRREYAFAVKKGDTALRDRLEQGLIIVKASGEYRHLYDRWLGIYEPRAFPLHYLVWGGAGIALALLLFAAWGLGLRRSRERMRLALQRFRIVFDLPLIGIAITSLDKGWIEVNDRLCAILGRSREALIRSTWLEMTHPDDVLPDTLQFDRVLAGEIDGYSMQKRFLREDGSVVPCDISAACVRRADGMPDYFVAVVQDISRRTLAEAELDRYRHHLEALVEARTQALHEQLARVREQEHLLIHQARLAAMGEMLGNIAHQWRQPLSALALVLGNLQDAERHQDLTPAYLAQKIADAHRLIDKMSTTISDFRDFFRPDKPSETFDLSQPVGAALALMEASLKTHGIAVLTDFCTEARTTGRPNEYSQVILNLLSNAKDAILARHPDGGQIVVRADRDGDQARVRVTDDGGGIAEAALARLFEPYFSTKPDGTGIGLYMSKMIIEKGMGGRLSACNRETGAEFTIATPLAPQEQ